MATNAAISGALALLHELYPSREIGPNTAPAWAMTFAEWDDETATGCVRKAAASPGRAFLPPPEGPAPFAPPLPRRGASRPGTPLVSRPGASARFPPDFFRGFLSWVWFGWVFQCIIFVRHKMDPPAFWNSRVGSSCTRRPSCSACARVRGAVAGGGVGGGRSGGRRVGGARRARGRDGLRADAVLGG